MVDEMKKNTQKKAEISVQRVECTRRMGVTGGTNFCLQQKRIVSGQGWMHRLRYPKGGKD